MQYRFTDKEIKEIKKNLTILVDTREQANEHIIKWFEDNKVKYKIMKLEYGDYSACLPIGSFKGQQRDIYFYNDIVIERKASIYELIGNLRNKKTNLSEIEPEIAKYLADTYGQGYLMKVLKDDYNRIKQELAMLNKYNIKFFIYVEDHLFDKHIRSDSYIGKFSQYKPATLYKRLKGLERDFNTLIRPIDAEYMGAEILNTLTYEILNVLKHEGYIEK